MKVGGIILTIIGALLAIFGVAANSSGEAQLVSFLSGNGTNPGTPLIIIGVILIAVGVVLIVLSCKKKKEKN